MENTSTPPNENPAGQEQPEELLYHYTKQQGLDGILSSGYMRATHYKFLNDATERAIGFNTYLRLIDKYAQDHSFIDRKFSNDLMEILISHLDDVDTYSISFSRNIKDASGKIIKNGDDRLSQWRGYALGEQGYCLGFYLQDINTIASNLQTKMQIKGFLGDCCYDMEIFESLATESADNIYKPVMAYTNDGIADKSPKNEFVKALYYYAELLMQHCTIYKHSGFNEEAETRFFTKFIKGTTDTSLINFRPGKLGNTPYIEIPMGIHGQPSSLSQITVGPSANQEQAMAILRIRLQQLGLSRVKVIPSEIPYRNW